MDQIPAVSPWIALVALVFCGLLALCFKLASALSTALHDISLLLSGGMPALKAPASGPALAAVVPAAAQPKTAPAPTPTAPEAVIDAGLVAAVKKFEGFSAKAYPDIKQYSIGYGTKATSSTEVITEAEAEKRLAAELEIAEQSVERFAPGAPRGVKQGLTSLTYNTGPIWEQQGLGECIKAGKYDEAKAHFVQYNHADGKVNEDLTKRRETEVAWFDNPL
jgi:GH24 family phage-related lysozyme (muramidase)